jgi:oxygen-independent coproporphyrinogen-3 oxidase
LSEEPAGLYFHIPFCSRVCPYCDFAVRTGDRARRRRFVDHLLAEIELHDGQALRYDTIYFGGGTPSSVLPEDFGRILDAVRRRFRFEDDVRIFVEVNPEDVTAETATAWRGLGVHTLSLGVQALNADGLEFLGRRHDLDQARRSVDLARDAGFESVSIDLIYGLPGQTASDWRGELDRALALPAQHVSCYQLTIHSRTRFSLLEKRGELTQLPVDEQGELFRLTHRHLNDAGMQGYEVSQFACAPEHRSRHNLKYWSHTPYLGLGPAAHSFHERRRWWNHRRTDPWQEAVLQGRLPVEGEERLDTRALVLEALMTGFRTYAGVDLSTLRSRWGVDLRATDSALINRLHAEGLFSLADDRLVPTLEGLALADSLASMFDAAVPAVLVQGNDRRV